MLKVHYVFILLVGVVLFLSLLLTANTSHGQALLGADFRGIFTGPYMAVKGAGRQLYDLSTQWKWQHSLFPQVSTLAALMPFFNPAFVALCLAPVALLPLSWAYVAWGSANIIIFGVIFSQAFRICKSELAEAPSLATPLFFLVISWVPFWVAIMQGQFSLFMVLALLFSWAALAKKQYGRAGLWLALLFIRPHLIIVPTLLLFVFKQYKVLQGLMLGVVSLIGVGLLLDGVKGLAQYVKTLLFIGHVGDAFSLHPAHEPTLKGIAHMLYGTSLTTP